MLVSKNWINKYVDIKEIESDVIYNRFTLATAEVEEVIVKNEYLHKCKVVMIKKIKKLDTSDKLNIVTVFDGNEEQELVCGADNIEEGMKTVFAPLGLKLPSGEVIKSKKIKGIVSNGMLCSEVELSVGEDNSGIIKLDSNMSYGDCLLTYFNKNTDVVLDIDNKSLTHRPDLWGHYGMAREFSTIFKKPLKELKTSSIKGTEVEYEVDVSSKNCLGYGYMTVSNVTIDKTPIWMSELLESVGYELVNPIVDLVTYVMLETGIPVFCYDNDKIDTDKIIVTDSLSKTFTDRDGNERTVERGDLVVCSRDDILSLGGMILSDKVQVTKDTKNILVEVANWKASAIRKTSVRMGLRTDSSQRYEKTLDSNQIEFVLERFNYLLGELSKGSETSEAKYESVKKTELIKIETSYEYITSVLGKEIPNKEIKRILEALSFSVEENDRSIVVDVPSNRATKDVSCDADIVEEIGRVVGYDNIIPEDAKLNIAPVKLSPVHKLQREFKNFMVYNAAAVELQTYPMIGKKLLEKTFMSTDNYLELVNYLSQEASIMRPSMIPSLLETLEYNKKYQREFKIFELGRVYNKDDNDFVKETRQFVSANYGDKNQFLKTVDDIELMLENSNIEYSISIDKTKNDLVDLSWKGLHPYEYSEITIDNVIVGVVFSIHPKILSSLKVKGHFTIAILNMDELGKDYIDEKKSYRALVNTQDSVYNVTVINSKNKNIKDIVGVVDCMQEEEIKSCKISDYYEKDNAVTLEIKLQDDENTLSGDRLVELRDSINKALSMNGLDLKGN